MNMKKIIGILWVMMLAMPAWSWATCTVNGLTMPGIQTVPAFSSTFNPSVANGTVIGSKSFKWEQQQLSFNCPLGLGRVLYSVTTGKEAAYSSYETAISGVGIRFSTDIPRGYWPAYQTLTGNDVDWWSPATITVELVKIGPITAGGKLFGEVAQMHLQNGAFKAISFVIDGVVEVMPTVPTCTATSPPPVSLGNIPRSQFAGVGTTTQAQSFNIGLTCSGGSTGAVTNAYVTLTDQADPANRSDTLSLTSASTATGVGIQVLSGATVVRYGPDSNAVGTENQWQALSSIGNGSYTIPLTARYIQTGPNVTPGTATGQATFTMSYQ
ncbi:fimbrial protein [Dyella sp. 20L07]|uniref:fimbrial protein n=1 Tax=Dyella sp. 20L07 TaxID=3384240 RepID=UPI003D26730C